MEFFYLIGPDRGRSSASQPSRLTKKERHHDYHTKSNPAGAQDLNGKSKKATAASRHARGEKRGLKMWPDYRCFRRRTLAERRQGAGGQMKSKAVAKALAAPQARDELGARFAPRTYLCQLADGCRCVRFDAWTRSGEMVGAVTGFCQS